MEGHARLARTVAVCLAVTCFVAGSLRAIEAPEAADRARMIRVIEAHAQSATEALGRDYIDPKVLAVMGDVPRHEFVPDDERGSAYEDRPLPIGYGQTISQPFIVALMTDLLARRAGRRACSRSAPARAIRPRCSRASCARCYTIEIMPELRRGGGERLARLGYANVATYVGDGYYGWPRTRRRSTPSS